jgi:hypothetical protein
VVCEATIDVQIKHVSGPVIVDGNHVRRWLTAGLVSANIGDGFDFEVCSGHSNPNDQPAGGSGFPGAMSVHSGRSLPSFSCRTTRREQSGRRRALCSRSTATRGVQCPSTVRAVRSGG